MNGLSITLSWVLIHSLWMAIGAWIISASLERFTKRSPVRRGIKVVGFGLFYVAVGVAFVLELPKANQGESNWVIFEEALFFQTNISLIDQAKLFITANSKWIAIAWLAGSLLSILRLTKQKHDLNQIQKYAKSISESSIKKQLITLKDSLGISRFVQLMETEMISSPMTTGFLRPIIYLPIGLATGLNHEEIEAILLHELAHIKRNDYLLNWILVITETLFFFNPIILVMVKQLRREMEYTCDDEVLNEANEISYARTLIKLEEFNLNNKLALQAKNNNSEFSKRINRMIKQQKPVTHQRMFVTSLLAITLILSTAFTSKTLKEEPVEIAVVEQDTQQKPKQDTLRFTSAEVLANKVKEMNDEEIKGTVLLLNGKRIGVIKDVNNSLKKADKMMEEIQEELIKDGLLNENRQKMTLMFQYSDLLNGKANLGDKYEKYKAIFNRYFPVYDSFATTRVFRYK